MDESNPVTNSSPNKQPHFITHLKDYAPTLKAGLIILLSLLVIYEIIMLFVDINPMFIPITVQEVPNTSGQFALQTKNILRMVLLGPVHGIIIYISLRPLLNRLLLTHKKIGQFLDIVLILFLMINCTGHIVHWLFDRANFLYREDNGYSANSSFLILYFADEFLGHALVHISYFVFFGILCSIEYILPMERNLYPDEWIIATGLGIGIGIINGIAAKTGESILILSILSVGAVLIIIICVLRHKTRPFSFKRSPFIWAFFIGSLFVVGYTLYFIIVDGFIAAYPYIT